MAERKKRSVSKQSWGYTPEEKKHVRDRVLYLLSIGLSQKKATKAAGVPYMTFMNWRKNDATFESDVATASEHRNIVAHEAIMARIEKKGDVEAAKIALRADDDEQRYSDRIEINQQVTHNLKITDKKSRELLQNAYDIIDVPAYTDIGEDNNTTTERKGKEDGSTEPEGLSLLSEVESGEQA